MLAMCLYRRIKQGYMLIFLLVSNVPKNVFLLLFPNPDLKLLLHRYVQYAKIFSRLLVVYYVQVHTKFVSNFTDVYEPH